MIHNKASDLLNSLKRTDMVIANDNQVSLLLPQSVNLYYLNSGVVKTEGLDKLDSKQKDLLRIISIDDALNGVYKYTSTLSPRTYAESLSKIPIHLTVQGLIFFRSTKNLPNLIQTINKKYLYGKTEYDNFLITDYETYENIFLVMNRRVGGWDGSIEKPVIELLGAGGHVPTVYDEITNSLKTLTPQETILKETQEELGILLSHDDTKLLGGFHNQVSSELVLLYGIFIDESQLPVLQEKAFGNIEENIDGLYIGQFNEIMNLYMKDATPFAGGEKAKPTNFPNQKELMDRVYNLLS